MLRQKYDHNELTGIDVDIEISLKEYGIAWIETETDILFYYGINTGVNDCGNIDYITFDFCSIDKDIDIKSEYDWADFDAVLSFNDMFLDEPLTMQLYTLLQYYGPENIFGSTYYEGLTYNEIVQED
jgi:hypothetical protein